MVEIRTHKGIRFLWHPVPGTWICQSCSGLERDYVAHADWHASLKP